MFKIQETSYLVTYLEKRGLYILLGAISKISRLNKNILLNLTYLTFSDF